jgi:hypothetical protein
MGHGKTHRRWWTRNSTEVQWRDERTNSTSNPIRKFLQWKPTYISTPMLESKFYSNVRIMLASGSQTWRKTNLSWMIFTKTSARISHLSLIPRIHRIHRSVGPLNPPVIGDFNHIPWRIHGAGIYANMTGVYWLDPWSTIYSSTMDPSWESMGYGLPICFPRFSKGNFTAQRLVPRPRDVSSFPPPCEPWSLKTWQCLSHDIGWSPW